VYKQVLVPLDGSTLAEGVLPYVKQLAGKAKLPVKLLRVAEPTFEELKGLKERKPSRLPNEPSMQEALDNLDAPAKYLRGLGVDITPTVTKGVPAVEIISEAEKDPGTLVAMATHGRSGVTRWLMGSVADKLLRYSDLPLLLIHPKDGSPIAPEPQLRTVIVPLDGSIVSEQVLPHVHDLARALSLKVILFRATTFPVNYPASTLGAPSPAIAWQSYFEEAKSAADSYLKKISADFEDASPVVETRHMPGEPAANIIDLASSTPDSFIAMTSRGQGGLARAVLGSVADRVVRHCAEPVLIVRPN
jgi:nucleotide-binding universal stress UspA family protein